MRAYLITYNTLFDGHKIPHFDRIEADTIPEALNRFREIYEVRRKYNPNLPHPYNLKARLMKEVK